MDDLRLLDEDCSESMDEALLEAVRNGNLKQLCALIDSGANVNACDVPNKTAVMCAAETGSYKSLYALIKAGADVNAVDDENNTAVFHADAGADVKKLNIYGRNALIRAAELLQKGCLEVLIKAGASVNMKLGNGETILSCVIGKNYALCDSYERDIARPQCLELLLEAGAEVNVPSQDGATPLERAISRSSIIERSDLIKPLLRHGADVNAVNVKKYNATPLIILASLVNQEGRFNWYDDQKIYCAQLLLKSGAHLKRDQSGFNALEHHIGFSKMVN